MLPVPLFSHTCTITPSSPNATTPQPIPSTCLWRTPGHWMLEAPLGSIYPLLFLQAGVQFWEPRLARISGNYSTDRWIFSSFILLTESLPGAAVNILTSSFCRQKNLPPGQFPGINCPRQTPSVDTYCDAQDLLQRIQLGKCTKDMQKVWALVLQTVTKCLVTLENPLTFLQLSFFISKMRKIEQTVSIICS